MEKTVKYHIFKYDRFLKEKLFINFSKVLDSAEARWGKGDWPTASNSDRCSLDSGDIMMNRAVFALKELIFQ